MSSGLVREDAPAASRADRAPHGVQSVPSHGSGMFAPFAMTISAAEALGRKIFDLPTPGCIDWMNQWAQIRAFLPPVYAQRAGGRIRMGIAAGQLRGGAAWIAEFAGVPPMLPIGTALLHGSFDPATQALTLGASTVNISLPTWPETMLAAVMFAAF